MASGLLSAAAQPAIGDIVWLAWICFVPWLVAGAYAGVREGGWLALLAGVPFAMWDKWDTMNAAVQQTGLPLWGKLLAHLMIFGPLVVPFIAVGLAMPWLRRNHTPMLAALQGAAIFALSTALATYLSPYTSAVLMDGFTRFIQIADLGGLPLICFVLMLSQQLLANAIIYRHEQRRAPQAMGAWLLILGVSLLYGHYRLMEYRALEKAGAGLSLQVLAIQTNMSGMGGGRQLLRDHPGGTSSAVELTRQGLAKAPQSELVVWPEGGYVKPLPGDTLDSVCRLVQPLAASFGRPLVLNCHVYPEPGQNFSEALFLNRSGEEIARYRKSNLVPLYEKWRGFFGLPFTVAGTGANVFHLKDGRTLVPAICYDIHDAGLIRRGVMHGGQFILHMASFAPFGRSQQISRWDLAMARLRAIENRR
ncbi:MAG: nitrilase-related carbon-nitrogen hydrolase, partial [Haliea sp.]